MNSISIPWCIIYRHVLRFIIYAAQTSRQAVQRLSSCQTSSKVRQLNLTILKMVKIKSFELEISTVAFKIFVMQLLTAFDQPLNPLESSEQMYIFGLKIKPRTNNRSFGKLDFASRKTIWAFTLTWSISFTTGSSTKEIEAFVSMAA